MVDRYDFHVNANKIHVRSGKLEEGKRSNRGVRSGESTAWLGRKITVNAPNLGGIELNRGSVIDFLRSKGFSKLDRGLLGIIGGSGDQEIKDAWNQWVGTKTFKSELNPRVPNDNPTPLLEKKRPTQNQPDLNPRIWNDNPTPLLKNKQPTQNQPDLNPRIWNDNPTPLLDKEKPALRFRQSTFGMKPLKNLTEAKQRLSEIATKFGGSFRIVESPPPENNPQISFQTQNSADFAALENALKKDSRGLITLENGWQKNKAENRLTLTFSESAMLLGHRIENHNDNNHIYAKSVLEELIHSKKNQKGIHPKFSGETPSLKQTFVQFIHSKLEKPVKNNHEAKQRLNEIATKFGGTFRIETPNQSLNPQISFQTEDFAILKDALKKGSNNSIELKHGWQKNVAENRITLTFSESAILLGHPIRRDGDHSEKTARSILAQLIS